MGVGVRIAVILLGTLACCAPHVPYPLKGVSVEGGAQTFFFLVLGGGGGGRS